MSKLKKSKFWILAGELSVDVGPLKSCLLQFIKFSCGADFAETSNKVNQRDIVETKPQTTNHFRIKLKIRMKNAKNAGDRATKFLVPFQIFQLFRCSCPNPQTPFSPSS